MKAIVCPKYGPPEVLQLREIEKPTPRANEVLIKIHTTTVTSGDCRARSFTVPPIFWLPGRLVLGIRKPKKAVLGSEFAGEVENIGQAVTRFKVGDQVFGLIGDHNFGTYAEYRCASEDDWLALKSAGLSYEKATAIPFAGVTALRFLKKSDIQPDQKVLIYGASSAVGTYAVQLAKHFGAQVTAVCSTANIEMVQSLGADQVIDYTQDDFANKGVTYDISFDTVGKTTFAHCQSSLKPKGFYLQAVMPLAGPIGLWYGMTTGKHIVGGRASDLLATPIVDDLRFLQELMESGQIKPIIDRRYPLEQIVEAHRYVDTGRKKGIVIVSVA